MRVTDGMRFDQALRSNSRTLEQYQRASEQATTGVRVSQPGDDPAAAGQIVIGSASQARYQALATITQQSSQELATVDGALATVSNVLSRAQQLAVQMANATYSASQRASAATEVDSLLTQIVSSANIQLNGRYLLAGSRDDVPPFDSSGNYLGNDAVRQVEIAPGVVSVTSVRADVALKGAAGGVDVLATLQSLSAALNANDPQSVKDLLGDLSSSVEQVATARAQVGDAMGALDTATSVNQAARDAEKTGVSKLSDADLVESATRLAQAQQALQASLAATSQGFRLSLLDYLK